MNSQELRTLVREEIKKIVKEAAASKAQQQAAGIALSVKRGDAPAAKLKDAGKAMVKMSEKELEKLAGTKRKDLPKKVKKENKNPKAKLKEGFAWDRSERKFGEPLPTLASVQKAYQTKQKMTEIGAFPTGPGRMTALRSNKSYSILDPGTDEWNEYKYLGEIGQGSTAGNPGDHMFYATDAPGVYVFVALSEEDLKTMIKEA